jgi:hypothetical protein
LIILLAGAGQDQSLPIAIISGAPSDDDPLSVPIVAAVIVISIVMSAVIISVVAPVVIIG